MSRMKPVTRQTAKCVYCMDAPATIWGGWVRRGNEPLLAGWCAACKRKQQGYTGRFDRRMGTRESRYCT